MNRIIYLLLEFAEAQVVKSSTVHWIKNKVGTITF
jgi:hypothetical protein